MTTLQAHADYAMGEKIGLTFGNDLLHRLQEFVDPTDAAYGASLSRTDNDGPFNAARADAITYGRPLVIPAVPASTPWKVSDSLTIPTASHGLKIIGHGRNQSFIQQQTNNTPVIKMEGTSHSLLIEGLYLGYASQQTTSHTNSYALQFAAASSSDQIYGSTFRQLRMGESYVGMGVINSGVPWGNSYEDFWITDYAYRGVDYLCGAGSPNNCGRNIYIQGRNGNPTGYAFATSAAEWRIDGLDCEEGIYRVLSVAGGRPVTIRGLHIETLTITENNSRIIEVANNNLTIEDLQFETVTINVAGTATLFTVSTAGSLVLDGFEASGVTLTSGTLNLLNAQAGRNGVYVRRYGTHANIALSANAAQYAGVRRFEAIGDSVQTFTDGDTTPDVSGFYYFKATQTNPTTITTFDNGHPGQEIVIIFTDANTTIAETDNIKLSAAFTSTADDTMRLLFDGTSWFETARSVN